MGRQVVVASARDPPARNRLDVNKPELRRKLVLSALEKGGATEVDRAASRPEALERAVELGVLTHAKLDFLLTAHAAWRAAPSPEDNFASTETKERDGLIPNFFPRAIPKPDVSAHWARRLGWHCTDCLTPIYADMGVQLADDLGVTERAVELILSQDVQAAYALTTLPGHHASADFYGGYCYVNHAALAMAMLKKAGRTPFLIDIDYHAGDGTAHLLGDGDAAARQMCSIHALNDYPYIPADAAWALSLPPATRDYKPVLAEALARRPAACDTIVLSLGYDVLKGDPCAAPGHGAEVAPADFGDMRKQLLATGLPLLAFQEGGYNLDSVPDAAAAFWDAGR